MLAGMHRFSQRSLTSKATGRLLLVLATVAGLLAIAFMVAPVASDATDSIGVVCPLGAPDANDASQCAYTVVQFVPGVYVPAADPIPARCPASTDPFIVVGDLCKELGAQAEELPCSTGQIQVTIVIPAEDRTAEVCFDALPKLDPVPAMPPMCNGLPFEGAAAGCGTETRRAVLYPAIEATATCPQGGTNTAVASTCQLEISAVFVNGSYVAATATTPATCNAVPTSVAAEDCLVIISPAISLDYQALEKGSCAGQPATVNLGLGQVPTEGNDVIVGTPGDDVIPGFGGDDVICGGGGNDIIWGQAGNDTIYGDDGDDKLRGGDGIDTLLGGDGADDLGGGRDNDRLMGDAGDDVALRGGTGNDTIDGGDGDDLLIAGNGGSDNVRGGAGNDVLVTGGPRPDSVHGDDGNDVVKGNKGADVLTGGAGDDEIRGGHQADTIDGGLGTDICNGGTTDTAVIEADTATNCETITQVP